MKMNSEDFIESLNFVINFLHSGGFYTAEAELLRQLEDAGLVPPRALDDDGKNSTGLTSEGPEASQSCLSSSSTPAAAAKQSDPGHGDSTPSSLPQDRWGFGVLVSLPREIYRVYVIDGCSTPLNNIIIVIPF